MHDNFEIGLNIVLGLEQRVTTNYPDDPGKLTVWGLSQVSNPEVYDGMSESEIKDIYYRKYWVVAGCNEQPFPMDVCLFDSQVNPQNDPKLPGGGNQEIMNMKPEHWQDYMIFRMQRYQRCSKPIYVKGHIFRVLNLCKAINELEGGHN